MNRMKYFWRSIAMLIFLTLPLSSCQEITNKLDIIAQKPEEVVAKWYDSINNRDVVTPYELVHPERENELEKQLSNPLSPLRSKYLIGMTYIDMNYLVSTIHDDQAVVLVTGKAVNKILGTIEDVNDTVVLKRYENEWKIWSVKNQFE
ncbi:MAG: hypothetical protein QW358_00405 [Candidatus Hadarchaeum sp.]